MTPAEARERFARAEVARLASVGAGERPHIVPIVFALEGEAIYSVLDDKPKRSAELKRFENLRANPAAAVLADHYEHDWTQLWWVRADGHARLLDPHDREALRAVALLSARYPQQRAEGPVLAVDVERWTGWAARQGPSVKLP
ncbi:MAG: TIGR03668 family PPOX class F420-dependent oxidoreductase [Solirubrobacteraceae bacterium]